MADRVRMSTGAGMLSPRAVSDRSLRHPVRHGNADQTVAEIVSCLESGVNVTLEGLRGSGRSFVASQVIAELTERGQTVIPINGVAALQDRQLTALAVSGISFQAVNGAALIAGAVTALGGMVSKRGTVVVIDDADDLDAASAGVIAAARVRYPFSVLTVTRRSGRRDSAARVLASEFQPSVLVSLKPLGFDQLHEFLHALLPGTVDPATVARIATKAGGLPGLVRSMVETGRRTGSITERDGIWRATGPLWDDMLTNSVELLLSDLDDEKIEALTLVALLGTVRIHDIGELFPLAHVGALERAGLFQIVGDAADPIVAVFPPLVGEYLRAVGSHTTWLTAQQFLARHPGSDSAPGPLQQNPRPNIAVISRYITEHQEAEVKPLRLAWEAAPSAATALPLLQALELTGASAREIDAVVQSVSSDFAADGSAELVQAWGEIIRALGPDDGTRMGSGAVAPAADPVPGGVLDAARLHISSMTHGVGEVATTTPFEESEAMAAARAEQLLIAGRPDDALAAMGEYQTGEPALGLDLEVLRGLGLIMAGDIDQGIERALLGLEVAEEHFDAAGIQSHAYVAAVGFALSGDLDRLRSLVDTVLTMTATPLLQQHYRVGLHVWAAVSASWVGNRRFAESVASQAEVFRNVNGPLPGMVPQLIAAVLCGTGDQADALWTAAAEAQNCGEYASAVFLAVAAAELAPMSANVTDLSDLAARVQGRPLRMLAEYANAAVARDAVALSRVSALLVEDGIELYGLRAQVSAAMVLREHEQRSAAVGLIEDAWAWSSTRGDVPRGIFARFVAQVGLSAREKEIVGLLSQGADLQQIAGLIEISPRTVENHIFVLYKKVGVEGRDRLVEAGSTWLQAGDD